MEERLETLEIEASAMEIEEEEAVDEAVDEAVWYEGDEILSWIVEEFERHQRGPLWYVLAITSGVGLLVYSVLTQNFLFAVIILMFAVILGLSALREPDQLPFIITTRGVGLGERFYHFKEFRSFWILHEPPHVSNVYLEFKRSMRPHLVVSLEDIDPLAVRETLIRFLEEDDEQEDEPLSDLIGRALKL